MHERRVFRRRPVGVDCHAWGQEGIFAGVIKDLCEDGLSFTGDRAWQIGEQISVMWKLDGDAMPMLVRGVVLNSTPDHTGVEFLNLELQDRLRIMHLLTGQSR